MVGFPGRQSALYVPQYCPTLPGVVSYVSPGWEKNVQNAHIARQLYCTRRLKDSVCISVPSIRQCVCVWGGASGLDPGMLHRAGSPH